MSGGDATSSFLIGRLAQEGLTPTALLAVTQGSFPGPGSSQALAVAGGRLWLAHSQLIGDPSLAAVPLADVGGASLQPTRRLLGGTSHRLTMTVAGRRLRFTAVADTAACEGFLALLA